MWYPRYDIRLDRRLRRIQAPTLVVVAEDDRLIPERPRRAVGKLIDGATLTTVQGDGETTGHLLIIQAPDRLAAVLAYHAAAAQ